MPQSLLAIFCAIFIFLLFSVGPEAEASPICFSLFNNKKTSPADPIKTLEVSWARASESHERKQPIDADDIETILSSAAEVLKNQGVQVRRSHIEKSAPSKEKFAALQIVPSRGPHQWNRLSRSLWKTHKTRLIFAPEKLILEDADGLFSTQSKYNFIAISMKAITQGISELTVIHELRHAGIYFKSGTNPTVFNAVAFTTPTTSEKSITPFASDYYSVLSLDELATYAAEYDYIARTVEKKDKASLYRYVEVYNDVIREIALGSHFLAERVGRHARDIKTHGIDSSQKVRNNADFQKGMDVTELTFRSATEFQNIQIWQVAKDIASVKIFARYENNETENLNIILRFSSEDQLQNLLKGLNKNSPEARQKIADLLVHHFKSWSHDVKVVSNGFQRTLDQLDFAIENGASKKAMGQLMAKFRHQIGPYLKGMDY